MSKRPVLAPRPILAPGARTIGIDPSLTATGVAMYTDADGWRVGHVATAPHTDGLRGLFARLDTITDGVLALVGGRFEPTDLVVIEGYTLTASAGRGPLLANWYHLARHLHDAGISPVVIDPATRVKYATGNGKGGKDQVMAHTYRRFPGAGVNTNDEADAVMLAALGRHLAGASIEPVPLPATHLSVEKRFAPPVT